MTTSTTNGVRAVKWLLAAAACLAAITSGCVIPPAQQRYVIIAQPMQPQRPQWQTIAPAPAPTVKTVKTVQPVKSAKSGMGGSSFSAPKAAKAEEVRSGDLDDVLARIHAHRQEKEGETRNAWLEANEVELGPVRSRLISMRIFAAKTADENLKCKVGKAISETEADLDEVRARLGNRTVGFQDAQKVRTALQQRHERLAALSDEYATFVGRH